MVRQKDAGRLTPSLFSYFKNPKQLVTMHRGVMMLEVLAALMIVMLASVYAAERYHTYLEEQSWQVAAAQATAFNNASKSYIADNTDMILNGTLPFKVTPSLLVQNGYLDKGFSVSSYGQTYVTSIVKNSKLADRLQALTCTTGGERLSFKGLRSVAAQIQGMGGYVDDSGTATGAYGGWTSSPADFGITCDNGHLAIALSSEVLGTAIQESDRLYRYKVNAKPDLNRMHTAIDMNGNDINSGGAIDTKTLTAEGDIKSNSGWLITESGKGWLNEAHGGGLYMDDNDWIKSLNGKGIYTSGQLKGGSVRSDGRLSSGEFLQLDGVAMAGASCDGRLVGLDSAGAVLTCQNQKWQSMSGGSFSRAGSGQLVLNAPGSYKNILVTVSSLFNGKDGSHTAFANFNVTVNGQVVGTVNNQVIVKKGGSSGHSWVYQSYAVVQRMFSVPVSSGSQIAVTMASSDFHVSSDIRVDLTD